MVEKNVARPDDASRQAEAAIRQITPHVIRIDSTFTAHQSGGTTIYSRVERADMSLEELRSHAESVQRKMEMGHREGGQKTPRRDAHSEMQVMQQSLAQMSSLLLQDIREEHAEELEDLEATLEEAREAAEQGDDEEAGAKLDEAQEKLSKLETVFSIEEEIYRTGSPEAMGEGMFEDVVGALHAALRDTSDERSGTILDAASLYAQNAPILNLDTPETKAKLAEIIAFIKNLGQSAQSGEAYTPERQQADRESFGELRAGVAQVVQNALGQYAQGFSALAQDLQRRISAEGQQEYVKEKLQAVLGEVNRMLERLGADRRSQMTPREAGEAAQGFVDLAMRAAGITPQGAEEARLDEGAKAAALRGTGAESERRAAQAGTPEWFGQQAQRALESGNRELAGLATMMGNLEKAANGIGQKATDFLPPQLVSGIIGLISGNASGEQVATAVQNLQQALDRKLGVSPARVAERVTDGLRSLRDGLASFLTPQSGTPEAAMLPQAQAIERQVAQAQEALAHNDSTLAGSILVKAQGQFRTLGGLAEKAKKLLGIGAPQEVVGAVQSAAQFIGTPNEQRASLIMDAAEQYSRCSQMPDPRMREEGGVLSQLGAFISRLADPQQQIDIEAETQALESIGREISETSATSIYQDAAWISAQISSTSFRDLLASAIGPELGEIGEEAQGLLDRLNDPARASSVTPEEIAAVKMHLEQALRCGGILRQAPEGRFRNTIGKILSAALGFLRGGGRNEDYELMVMSASEMSSDPRRYSDAANDVAQDASRLAGAGPEQAREARTALGSRLIPILTEKVQDASDRLENGGALETELDTLGQGLIDMAATPEEFGVDDMAFISSALSLIAPLIGEAESGHHEPAAVEGAMAIAAKAIEILRRGGDIDTAAKIAAAQMTLALTFINAPAEQRAAIQSFAEALQTDRSALEKVSQLGQLQAQLAQFTEASERSGLDEQAQAAFGTAISELRQAIDSLIGTGHEYSQQALDEERSRLEGALGDEGQALAYLQALSPILNLGDIEATSENPATDLLASILQSIAEHNGTDIEGAKTALASMVVDATTQEKLGRICAIAQAMDSAMQSLHGSARHDAATLFAAAISALSDGRTEQGVVFSTIALAYAQTNDTAGRAAILHAYDRYKLGELRADQARAIVGIEQSRAGFLENAEEGFRTNINAYFDLAEIAAENLSIEESAVVSELAAAYATWASVKEEDITDPALRERRDAEMRSIESRLGEYSGIREMARGRARIISTPMDMRERMEAPLAIAIIDGVPLGTAMGGANENDARLKLIDLRAESETMLLHADSASFASVFGSILGSDSRSSQRSIERYEREKRRLLERAEREEGRGNPGLAAWYRSQAELIDRGMVEGAAAQASELFVRGQDERVLAIESRRQAAHEEVAGNGQEAERLMQEAQAHESRAQELTGASERMAGGLEQLDRSIQRISTRHRENGRSELAIGIRTEFGTANGYLVDALGNSIPTGETRAKGPQEAEYVMASAEQLAGQSAAAESYIAQGIQSVQVEAAVQRSVNSGIALATTNVHERNIDGAREFAQRMIDRLPPEVQAQKGEFQTRLDEAVAMEDVPSKIAKLQELLIDLSRVSGVESEITRIAATLPTLITTMIDGSSWNAATRDNFRRRLDEAIQAARNGDASPLQALYGELSIMGGRGAVPTANDEEGRQSYVVNVFDVAGNEEQYREIVRLYNNENFAAASREYYSADREVTRDLAVSGIATDTASLRYAARQGQEHALDTYGSLMESRQGTGGPIDERTPEGLETLIRRLPEELQRSLLKKLYQIPVGEDGDSAREALRTEVRGMIVTDPMTGRSVSIGEQADRLYRGESLIYLDSDEIRGEYRTIDRALDCGLLVQAQQSIGNVGSTISARASAESEDIAVGSEAAQIWSMIESGGGTVMADPGRSARPSDSVAIDATGLIWVRNGGGVIARKTEGPVEGETPRQRELREDTNAKIHDTLVDWSDSYGRDAGRHYQNAEAHSHARALLLEPGAQTLPDSLILLDDLVGGIYEFAEPGMALETPDGVGYRVELERIRNISDVGERRRAANDLFMAIAADEEAFSVGLIGLTLEYSESQRAQLEAQGMSAQTAQLEEQLNAAWTATEINVDRAIEQLHLGNNAEIARMEQSQSQTYGFTPEDHRAFADRRIALAGALLSEETDIRAHDIMANHEPVRTDNGVRVDVLGEMADLNAAEFNAMLPYVDEDIRDHSGGTVSNAAFNLALAAGIIVPGQVPDTRGARERLGSMAISQTALDLASLGFGFRVEGTVTEEGRGKAEVWEWDQTPAEREMVQTLSAHQDRLRGQMQNVIFGHDSAWGADPQIQFLARVEDRMDSLEAGTLAMSQDHDMHAAQLYYQESVPFQLQQVSAYQSEYRDVDAATNDSIRGMQRYASYYRTATAVGEYAVATAGVILSPVTGGASLSLTIGVGALGVYRGFDLAHQKGEWDWESGSQVAMGALGIVLAPIGEISSIQRLWSGARGIQRVIYTAEEFVESPLAMRMAVHGLGGGMVAFGGVQFIAQYGQMREAVERGEMTWLEFGFTAFSSIGQPLAQYGFAARMGGQMPRSAWRQAFDVLVLGNAPDFMQMHALPRPVGEETSYRAALPEMGYAERVQVAPKARLDVLEGGYEAYRDRAVELGEVSGYDPAQARYIEARRSGQEPDQAMRTALQAPEAIAPPPPYHLESAGQRIEYSREYASAATELTYHADRLAMAGEAERPAVLESIPPGYRVQAEHLASDPIFRRASETANGDRSTPEAIAASDAARRDQAFLGFSEAGALPALQGSPDAAVSAVQSEVLYIAEQYTRGVIRTEQALRYSTERHVQAEGLRASAQRTIESGERLLQRPRTPEEIARINRNLDEAYESLVHATAIDESAQIIKRALEHVEASPTEMLVNRFARRMGEFGAVLTAEDRAMLSESIERLRQGRLTTSEFWRALDETIYRRSAGEQPAALMMERPVPTFKGAGLTLQSPDSLAFFLSIGAEMVPGLFTGAAQAGMSADASVNVGFASLDLVRQNFFNSLSRGDLRVMGDVNILEYFTRVVRDTPGLVNKMLASEGIDAFVTSAAFGISSDEGGFLILARDRESAMKANDALGRIISSQFGFEGSALDSVSQGMAVRPYVEEVMGTKKGRVGSGAAFVELSVADFRAMEQGTDGGVPAFIDFMRRMADSRIGGEAYFREGTGLPRMDELPESSLNFMNEEARSAEYHDASQALGSRFSVPQDRMKEIFGSLSNTELRKNGSVIIFEGGLRAREGSGGQAALSALSGKKGKMFGAVTEGRIGLSVSNLPSQASGEEFIYINRHAAAQAAERFMSKHSMEEGSVQVIQTGPGPDFIFVMRDRRATEADISELSGYFREAGDSLLVEGFITSTAATVLTGEEINFGSYRSGVRYLKDGEAFGRLDLPPEGGVVPFGDIPPDFASTSMQLDGAGNILGIFFTSERVRDTDPVLASRLAQIGGETFVSDFTAYLEGKGIRLRNWEDLRVALESFTGGRKIFQDLSGEHFQAFISERYADASPEAAAAAIQPASAEPAPPPPPEAPQVREARAPGRGRRSRAGITPDERIGRMRRGAREREEKSIQSELEQLETRREVLSERIPEAEERLRIAEENVANLQRMHPTGDAYELGLSDEGTSKFMRDLDRREIEAGIELESTRAEKERLSSELSAVESRISAADAELQRVQEREAEPEAEPAPKVVLPRTELTGTKWKEFGKFADGTWRNEDTGERASQYLGEVLDAIAMPKRASPETIQTARNYLGAREMGGLSALGPSDATLTQLAESGIFLGEDGRLVFSTRKKAVQANKKLLLAANNADEPVLFTIHMDDQATLAERGIYLDDNGELVQASVRDAAMVVDMRLAEQYSTTRRLRALADRGMADSFPRPIAVEGGPEAAHRILDESGVPRLEQLRAPSLSGEVRMGRAPTSGPTTTGTPPTGLPPGGITGAEIDAFLLRVNASVSRSQALGPDTGLFVGMRMQRLAKMGITLDMQAHPTPQAEIVIRAVDRQIAGEILALKSSQIAAPVQPAEAHPAQQPAIREEARTPEQQADDFISHAQRVHDERLTATPEVFEYNRMVYDALLEKGYTFEDFRAPTPAMQRDILIAQRDAAMEIIAGRVEPSVEIRAPAPAAPAAAMAERALVQLIGREAAQELSALGITPATMENGALKISMPDGTGGAVFIEMNYETPAGRSILQVRLPEQAHGEPEHVYRFRVRQSIADAVLAQRDSALSANAPGISAEARKLYLVARDSQAEPGRHFGFGTADERAVASQMLSDPQYISAMERGDIGEALAISERYSHITDALSSNETEFRQGAYVDTVSGARQVIAIGDVHGDAYGLADQLLRGGILIDTRPDLAPTDRSIAPAQRYRLNPDLPPGTQIVFTGDYIDRGPTSVEAVMLVRQMQQDAAFTGSQVHALRGNHEELFRRFVEAYRGKSQAEVQAILDGTMPDALSDICDWGRIGVQDTFDSILQRYHTWENFIAENFDSQGNPMPGSLMEFIGSTRAVVVVDNNFFTHGGPVMTDAVLNAGTREAAISALDTHFTRLFSTTDNHWAKTELKIPDMLMGERTGDFSSNYSEGFGHGIGAWAPYMAAERGQRWMGLLGVDQLYFGHERGNGVRSPNEFITNIDVSMSEAYDGGSGYVVIDPLQRTGFVRVQESRADAKKPESFGIPDASYSPRDYSNGRTRQQALDTPIARAAGDVYEGRVPMPLETGAGQAAGEPRPEASISSLEPVQASPETLAQYAAILDRSPPAGAELSFANVPITKPQFESAVGLIEDIAAVHAGTKGLLDIAPERRAALQRLLADPDYVRFIETRAIRQQLFIALETVKVIEDASRLAAFTQRPSDPLDAIAYDIAHSRASQNGRELPDAEDFGHAAMARRALESGSPLRLEEQAVHAEFALGASGALEVTVQAEDGTPYVIQLTAEGATIVRTNSQQLAGETSRNAAVDELLMAFANSAMHEALSSRFEPVIEQLRRGNFGTAARMLEGRVPESLLAQDQAAAVASIGKVLGRMVKGQATDVEQAAALDSFALLPAERQTSFISELHSSGKHAEAMWLTEFQAMNGRAGAGIETDYGIPPGTLSTAYMKAPSISAARYAVAVGELGIANMPFPWKDWSPVEREQMVALHRLSATYSKFDSLSDDHFLSGMFTTGDLAGIIRDQYGAKISSIQLLGGLIGAYRIELNIIDPVTGSPMVLFLKRQDLRPDSMGSSLSILSGIPAPDVLTANPAKESALLPVYAEAYRRFSAGQELSPQESRMAGEVEALRHQRGLGNTPAEIDTAIRGAVARASGLEYILPNGKISRFGLLGNMGSFSTRMPIAGRNVEVRAVEAAPLGELPQDSAVFRLLSSGDSGERSQFYEELGYMMTGSYAIGTFDRHELNAWGMLLEIVDPTDADLAAWGYRAQRDAMGHIVSIEPAPGAAPARRLGMDSGGRILMASIGGIDNDSAGAYISALDDSNRYDFSFMHERIGDLDLHRLFVRLARERNVFEGQLAAAQGRQPAYVGVGEILAEAFGTPENPGPFIAGLLRWMGEVGASPEYQAAIIRSFTDNAGGTVGMGGPLDDGRIHALRTAGYTFHAQNFNGESQTPVRFEDGRAVMMPRYETISTQGWPAQALDAFPPNGMEVYIVPLTPDEAQAIRATGSAPVFKGGKDGAYAIYWDAADIPLGFASRRIIPASRTGDTLRGYYGMSETTGLPARMMGPVSVFESVMAGGEGAMAKAWFRIRDIIIREEGQAEMDAGISPQHLQAYAHDRYRPDLAWKPPPASPYPGSDASTNPIAQHDGGKAVRKGISRKEAPEYRDAARD